MPSLEQWQATQKALSEQQRKLLEGHHRAQADVGRRADTVVAHEGWQVFLDHLTAMTDTLDKRIQGQERTILDTPALGDELVKAKIELRELIGERRGIKAALDLIPTLVATGHRASELLSNELT